METISRAAGARSFDAVLRSTAATAHRYDSVFQRAKAGEFAFRSYPTAGALHEVLAMKSYLLPEERHLLARALVRSQRAAAHPLWQALLLRAFEPLLRRLRMRDRGATEDRDQRVLHAFLHAVATLPVSCGPVFVAIGRATARELFGAVRREARGAEGETFDEHAAAIAPLPHQDAHPFVACLAREVAERLGRRSDGEDLASLLTGVETLQEQASRYAVRLSTYGRRTRRALCAVRRELGPQ
jgi:hypothetical protein